MVQEASTFYAKNLLIDLRYEIQSSVKSKIQQIDEKIVHRALVYTLSGTCLVDLKNESSNEFNKDRKNGLKSDYLVNFLT